MGIEASMRRAAESAWLRFAGLLGVVLIAATLFFEGFDFSGVVAEISDANLFFVALAVIVYTASWYPRGLRYRDLLIAMGYVCSTKVMTGAIFVSQTGNLVFPARAGDATRAYVVNKRANAPYSTGVASLTAERFLDVIVVTALAALGVVGVVIFGGSLEVQRHGGVLLGTSVFVLVVVAVTTVLVGFSRSGLGWASSLPFVTVRATEVAQGFVDDIAAIFDSSSRFGGLVATSLAAWGLDVVAGALVFYAVGVSGWVVVPASLVGVSVGNLTKAVPATPGGLGLYEAGFVASVTALLPVGWEVVLAVAILDHALKNGVTVVGGVVSAAVLNVSLTQRVVENKTESTS